MIRVEARNGEPLEKTLRRFKKRCEKEGLVKDIKKNLFYEKPSETKRREGKRILKRREAERAEAARARA
jgi:small subunit ribosomal protein S21